jgi:hypothetical protein
VNDTKEPTMICSKCGADRFKVPCQGDISQCAMVGTAQADFKLDNIGPRGTEEGVAAAEAAAKH